MNNRETTPVRLPPEHFRQVVELTPLVSIDLVVRDARSRMLLGWRRNRPAKDFWFVPGGRIGKNETLQAAFARITAAELGRVQPFDRARFLGVFEHIYEDNFAGDPRFGTHYVVLAYEIDFDPATLAPADDQHSAYLWLPDAEILARADVHPNTRAYSRKA